MRIERVKAALKKLERRGSVEKVLALMEVRTNPALATDHDYQRTFNGHYRMGRKTGAFYRYFFSMLQEAADAPSPPSLETTLQTLHAHTGERHLSFGTKMLATITDDAVIFDRNVAGHFGVPSTPLPRQDWLSEAVRRYEEIRRGIQAFTQTPEWQQVRALFDDRFPKAAHLSEIRKADLIIWAAYEQDFQPRFSLSEEEWFQVGITYFVAGRWNDMIAPHWHPVPRASLHSECEAEDCVLAVVKRMHESSVPRRDLVKHFFLPIQLLLMAQKCGDFLTIQQEPAFSRAGKSNFADLYDAYAFGSGGEAGLHREWTRIQAGFGESPEESEDVVIFTGGPGLTKETAVRIYLVPDRTLVHRREAEPTLMGEYWYLAYNYGRMGTDWVRESQMLLKRDETGKMYDFLDVRFKDGGLRQIYFDISHLPY